MKKTKKKRTPIKISSPKSKMQVYRARILHTTAQDRLIEHIDGALAVNSRGRIVFCGRFDDFLKLYDKRKAEFKIVDKRGRLIIPGMIDCHLHLPQLDLRGKHGSTLLNWLDRYIFPAEVAFADPRYAEALSKRFFKKLILNGATTSAVYTTIHAKSTDIAFRVAKESGLRVIMGKMMMDQHSPDNLTEDTRQSLNESEKLCEKWHGANKGKLMYAFTPRFAPTCSEHLLDGIGKLAKESGAYVQSHIAETAGEVKRVKELFPDYDDYTAVYEENDCFGPKAIMGHAIHLSDDELHRFALAKTKIAHCPTSNFFLKSGRMPIERIEEHGIVYGLGTDVGAGTSLSLFTTMRHADFIQPSINVSPVKAFYLATLGGAKTLSLEHEVGNFEEGKAADFCVIDICGIDPRYKLGDLTGEEALSLLVYRGIGNVIKETFVSGEKLDVDKMKIKGE